MSTVEEMPLPSPIRLSADGINITSKGEEMQLLSNKSRCTLFSFN
jgi:hypothetical protein